MLKYQGQQVNQVAIWFVDGLAIAANSNPYALLLEKKSRSLSFDWFDIFICILDNEPARIWKADIQIGANFEDKFIASMVADFWCSQTSNKAYWKSWWVETVEGDLYNHEFTCHHQSDAADHFNRSHPGVQISSVAGKDRVYLGAIERQMVDSDPFKANQPISTLLQFDSVR